MLLTALKEILDTFIEREEGTGGEDEHGGQQDSEEALFAVTEGMLFVWGASLRLMLTSRKT